MRQVIDGKIYDTEKSTFLCEYSYCRGRDFRNEETSLYKTKKGNFFFAGHGGPMSSWATGDGQGEISGSEGIRLPDPFDGPDEVLRFAEKHMTTDEYLEFFKAEEA